MIRMLSLELKCDWNLIKHTLWNLQPQRKTEHITKWNWCTRSDKKFVATIVIRPYEFLTLVLQTMVPTRIILKSGSKKILIFLIVLTQSLIYFDSINCKLRNCQKVDRNWKFLMNFFTKFVFTVFLVIFLMISENFSIYIRISEINFVRSSLRFMQAACSFFCLFAIIPFNGIKSNITATPAKTDGPSCSHRKITATVI